MTGAAAERPSIFVLTGVNGAGKSSVAGASFRASGANYFNPDEATRDLIAANRGMTESTANELAWTIGKQMLEDAIKFRSAFAFETTLGGTTITKLLEQAIAEDLAVRVWYVGLATVELHIERVSARVAAGGHDIPEVKIRERYEKSRLNLIRLIPGLTQLRVFDNSVDAGRSPRSEPSPVQVLSMREGVIEECQALESVPHWAKPIVLAALACKPPEGSRH